MRAAGQVISLSRRRFPAALRALEGVGLHKLVGRHQAAKEMRIFALVMPPDAPENVRRLPTSAVGAGSGRGLYSFMRVQSRPDREAERAGRTGRPELPPENTPPAFGRREQAHVPRALHTGVFATVRIPGADQLLSFTRKMGRGRLCDVRPGTPGYRVEPTIACLR